MRLTCPLAIMPSADQVPVKSTHSRMRWHKWVVLTAGSTGSALRAVRPPNLHITPDVRRDLVRPLTRPGSCTARPWPSWPTPFGRVYCKRDRRNLGWSPRQQCRKPWPMFAAVGLGIADDRERAGHKQAAEITIALFADNAEPVLAPARMLLRHQANPGGEVTA